MLSYERYYKAQGRKIEYVQFILREFDKYLLSIDFKSTDSITEDIFLGWLSRWDNLSKQTKYHAGIYLISFLKYLNNCGIQSYVPRPPKAVKSQYIPYIFSEDKILKLFETCDNWRDRYYTYDSHALVMPALLRLLYSTGIRINEALSLKNKDVNLKKHYILLENTKNYQDRLAPINPSLESVLKEYIQYRNRLAYKNISSPDSPFFITHSGRACRSETILLRFKGLIEQMGLNYQNGIHGVRVHDLRHTACVHALVKMVRNGQDPYCCLPILSVFMGHFDTKSTEYYLRLTQEAYPDIIKLDMANNGPIGDVIKRALNNKTNED